MTDDLNDNMLEGEVASGRDEYSDDGLFRFNQNDDAYAGERIISSAQSNDDKTAESALRPKVLDEFIGQEVVREQVDLIVKAALKREAPPDHILLSGSPGLGKTTLAMIVAEELGVHLRITSGPTIQHAGDLAAILSSLEEGEVLFVDEIHRLARAAEELLYIAMEDFRVDVIVGKGVGANSIPLKLPHFTVIGATTRAGLLPAPLRDRFGFVAYLDFYDASELREIVKRSARLLKIEIDDEATHEIALRSRGTPRIANRLLRRVRDWAEVSGNGKIDLNAAKTALNIYEIDGYGLDKLDIQILDALCKRFRGAATGISSLASAVGEEVETIESLAEPYLVREGFITRTPRGRMATQKAYQHLGVQMLEVSS
ncbi:MAG: Holliday junction branch migration DNA helicase RuvB [Bifidobacteriaceae bacterium]|jgi:Holliday junction DNA helicase RuvB|nr:Holliday junction branch migration DNA helicase RuvB [Bifidobacteriaceae bacterium]